MSYCRWSSMDYKCDLYVYEHVDGGWRIHVAANRRTMDEDLYPPHPPNDLPRKELIHRVVDRWQVVGRLLDEHATVEPIELPHAGECFSEPTPGACAARMRELEALGYMFPSSALRELDEEQKELDAKEATT